MNLSKEPLLRIGETIKNEGGDFINFSAVLYPSEGEFPVHITLEVTSSKKDIVSFTTMTKMEIQKLQDVLNRMMDNKVFEVIKI